MLLELLKNPKALFLAIILHLAVVLLFLLSLTWKNEKPVGSSGEVIKLMAIPAIATTTHNAQLALETKVIIEEKDAQTKKVESDRKKASAKARTEKLRKKRLVKERKHRRKIAAHKKAEKKRQEKARKKALAREKQEAEKEEQRQLTQEKAERIAETRRIALEAKKRQTKATQKSTSSNEAGVSIDQLTNAGNAWGNKIRQRVSSRWRRPANSVGMSAQVVLQIRAPGYITRLKVKKCSGTTKFCDSLINAIHRSEPFPKPDYLTLYDESLRLIFEP